MKTTKTIYVYSWEKTMFGCIKYAESLLNSMNARRVPCTYKTRIPRSKHPCVNIKTPQLKIFIFPSYADMTGRRPVDEAFYFPEETAKYLYGKRYSERYGGYLIDYIVEVEGGMPRNDGKEFIHEYDT